MSSILTVLMFVILLAAVGVLYTDGLWSNAIRLINVVTSALVATSFFEPVARWLDDWQPSYTYYWDFLSLWILFAVSMVIVTELTNRASKVKVRFIKLADQIGGVILSAWVGWVLVCFTMTTLHAAPLACNFMFGGFQPKERMMVGLGPDRQWLGFVQKESMGAFDRSNVFDPKADFMPNYAARRTNLEEQVSKNGSTRVN